MRFSPSAMQINAVAMRYGNQYNRLLAIAPGQSGIQQLRFYPGQVELKDLPGHKGSWKLPAVEYTTPGYTPRFSRPDYGPLFTMDDLPVPYKSYEEETAKLNKKFNLIFLASLIPFLVGMYYMWYMDILKWEYGRPPRVYRYRYKEIEAWKAKEAEEAAAKAHAAGAHVSTFTKIKGDDSSTAKASAVPIKEASSGGLASFFGSKSKAADKKPAEPSKAGPVPVVIPPSKLPESVPYLIVGAGTAAISAVRTIRAADPESKVLIIGDEGYYPYMRPPLSKDMWHAENTQQVAQTLKFKTWGGKERNLMYEKDEFYIAPEKLNNMEHGGVSVARSMKVVRIDAEAHKAYTEDGQVVEYKKCLLATGGHPRHIPVLEKAGPEVNKHVTLYRGADDFKSLEDISRRVKSVVIIGGGFLGSELACALGKKAKNSALDVTQCYPEAGNMAKVLPQYLSEWTTEKVKKEGASVVPNAQVVGARMDGNEVVLEMKDGKDLRAEHVIVSVGLEPNTQLAETSGLEIEPTHGGFRSDAELRARTDVWVAGDCASFYDVKLGRRRVEHHDHAVVSGRLAGENMTGAGKPYHHQSMFWSDLGPDVGYEAIGLVDSSLPTVGVFAKASEQDSPKAVVEKTGEPDRSTSEAAAKLNTAGSSKIHAPQDGEDYGKGVIFYTKGKRIVGVLMWNVFNRMPIARKVLKEQKEYNDLNEVAKLFNIHASDEELAEGE